MSIEGNAPSTWEGKNPSPAGVGDTKYVNKLRTKGHKIAGSGHDEGSSEDGKTRDIKSGGRV